MPARRFHRSVLGIAALLLGGCAPAPGPGASLPTAEQRIARLERQVAAGEKTRDRLRAWCAGLAQADATPTDGFYTDPESERHLCDDSVEGHLEAARRLPDPAPKPGLVSALVDLRRQLRAQDVDLLVVFTPARTAVYPDLAVRQPEIALADAPLVSWQSRRIYLELERHEVEVLDLLPTFLAWRARFAGDEAGEARGEHLFLDTDVHWSSAGASLAATAIGERIKGYDWFREVEASMGHALLLERPLSCTLFGSVIRNYIKRGQMAAPGPREQTTVHTVRISGEAPVLGQTDRGSPILILGDSQANLFSFNSPCDAGQAGAGGGLPDHLLRVLGFRVDVIASPGGAFVTSRQNLAARRSGVRGKRLVVEVISGQALFSNARRWPLIDLGGAR